jgi:hypothetical protein
MYGWLDAFCGHTGVAKSWFFVWNKFQSAKLLIEGVVEFHYALASFTAKKRLRRLYWRIITDRETCIEK